MPPFRTRATPQTYPLEGVGPILLRHSRRARRLILRVKPDGQVLLTLPWNFSLSAAIAFADDHRQWLIQKLDQLAERRIPPIIYKGEKPLTTRTHRLQLLPARVEHPTVSIRPGLIAVRYPAYQKITTPEIQAAITHGLTEAYRREAKEFLPQRVEYLAKLYGFSYQRVAIKNHKSCWGSCSKRNNLNLNLHLMRLPNELIDYVILHELTHTRVHNHSPQFWQALERILPNARCLRKQLQQYGRAGYLTSVLAELQT